MTEKDIKWYIDQIRRVDPKGKTVTIDEEKEFIIYTKELRSDESSQKDYNPEEFVHALLVCLLVSNQYKYPINNIYHEQYFKHGSSGSLSDEVDFLIYDDDDLPYALWEIKASSEYVPSESKTIQYQLFGTAPLTGGPKYLVYATIHPTGVEPVITLKCIDYLEHQSYESWINEENPAYTSFPVDYQDIDYEPLKKGSENDLKLNCTQADFRSVATTFHNEFFGEHPDNVLFSNLVKCLLAKIYDERMTEEDETYSFQIFQKTGKAESSIEIYKRINQLYSTAYSRFIDPTATDVDEINSKEFSPEKVKTVVKVLQSMSITKGASTHGDVIGAFFEEILRFGFKQDKGMYFTHDNIATFMINAVDLPGLTEKVWKSATHPDNRLPYVIDPACGSGTFLLKAMNTITTHLKSNPRKYKTNLDAEEFFNARLSDTKPNYWAENFIYGMDPKFIMAITAKVNMVLHGDGSAHIYKYDAYKGFNYYDASQLRVASDSQRTIPRAKYNYDTCETFDLVISNPPFGVTLSGDTKSKFSKAFSLKESLPSEATFIERCFQLLKPNGRLALVIPESVLNSSDNIDARLYLYRKFKIRCIVSLPRNVFKDTPTLTSLLFAQKKTKREVELWDKVWEDCESKVESQIKALKAHLGKLQRGENTDPSEIKNDFISMLHPVVKKQDWFLKRGKNSAVETIDFDITGLSADEAIQRCKGLLAVAGFKQLLVNYVFREAVKHYNYKFPVYTVDEVGYKLSNRKEKAKPNQLCKFVSKSSGVEKPNIHLMDEEYEIAIDTASPKTVLDHIKKNVKWD